MTQLPPGFKRPPGYFSHLGRIRAAVRLPPKKHQRTLKPRSCPTRVVEQASRLLSFDRCELGQAGRLPYWANISRTFPNWIATPRDPPCP